jgi:acyl transferase domain-containing protein
MRELQTIFMFSGQGSQYFQMGRALFEHNETFAASMVRMDARVRELCGTSVIESLYDERRNRGESFDGLRLASPAIFMVEVALARTLIHAGIQPQIALGASLGSYAAAVTVGALDADVALEAVLRQAAVFEAHAEPGGMIAVFAHPDLHREPALRDHCEIAASNFPAHFVIAAPAERLASLEKFLHGQGVLAVRLPVRYAFHSQWIDAARPHLLECLRPVAFAAPRMSLICCASGTAVTEISSDYFWRVARQPVQFHETIRQLESGGCYRYIDVGPAGSLAGFVKYSLSPASASVVQSVLTPFGRDLENLSAAVAGAPC